jgi:tetratricopeptide (TPR) repeat protein
MYPYLTPFGIIMKINREPVPEITQEMIDKDHAFWRRYAERLTGDWITYDTTVKQICDWAEDVYLRHDYHALSGDRKFARDEDAQKAFSKLRSSIACSIYQWRSRPQNSRSATERTRVTKEAEFAFKQAFACCPYSPEAVFHFMDLLLSRPTPRVDDAILILQTCHKLDPHNDQVTSWIDTLKRAKLPEQTRAALAQMQQALAQGQTNAAVEIIDHLLNIADSDSQTLMTVADSYLHLHEVGKSQQVLLRLTQILPEASFSWYNLAAVQAYRGEVSHALDSLKKSMDLNAKELAKDPKATNLRAHLFEDNNLASLRQRPEFKAAFATNKP